MGALVYGDGQASFDIDDRTLAHLQIVFSAKLRRRQGFFFTVSYGSTGRASVWVSPSIALYFKYYGSRQPAINREWVERLLESSNTSGGLVIVDEPSGV